MDEVVRDEKLGTFVVGYEDYGIKYCMRYWLYDYADILYIQDKVLTRLWYILRRHHIKIPYPIHELHLENDFSDKAEEELIKMRAKWHQQLKNIDLLKDLEEEQLQFLAENIEMQIFAKNDPLVKQGDEGDSMYLIISGNADVFLENKKERIYVATKGKGEFFGEMSLLTGEPRSATLIAKNDMLTAIINKVKFSEILMKDERILDKLLSALEENKSDLNELMTKAKIDKDNEEGSARKQLVKYIRNYLGLLN
jgi:CRP-like cAMP-binding protein